MSPTTYRARSGIKGGPELKRSRSQGTQRKLVKAQNVTSTEDPNYGGGGDFILTGSFLPPLLFISPFTFSLKLLFSVFLSYCVTFFMLCCIMFFSYAFEIEIQLFHTSRLEVMTIIVKLLRLLKNNQCKNVQFNFIR